MTDMPAALDGLPVHWAGADDTTPNGCTLVVTTYLEMLTTYIIRNGCIIGRIETNLGRQIGYAGDRLKGGTLLGAGDLQTLAAKIARTRGSAMPTKKAADLKRGDAVLIAPGDRRVVEAINWPGTYVAPALRACW